MTCRKIKFTGFLALKHCNPETEAEPKRNISCVAQNDFSPKMLQVAYRAILRGASLQGGCQRKQLRFVSWFDTFIKPIGGVCKGRYLMRLALQDTKH